MEIEIELKITSPIALLLGFAAGVAVGYLLTQNAGEELRALPQRLRGAVGAGRG